MPLAAPALLVFLVMSLICCSTNVSAQAQRNVTVDDEDPAIAYRPDGAWFVSANSSLDFGHAHMLTQEPNATAIFNFTGIAIYFLSPRWPYLVNTALSLDGGPSTLVDLVDHTRPDTGGFGPETVQWDVVWSAQNLTNTTHSLVISVGAGQRFGIVDGIIYTVLEPESTTTSAAPPPPATESSSTSSSTDTNPTPTPNSTPQSSGSSSRMRITVGSVLGVLGLLLILLSVWFCVHKRRRNRPRSEAWTIAPSHTTGKYHQPQSPKHSLSSHVSSTEKASPMRTTTTTATTTTGPSPISLGPPASYPSPSTRLEGIEHPYSSAYYSPGGGNGEIQAYQNPRFGYVGIPAPQDVISPDLSLKQYAEGLGAWYNSGHAGGGYGQYPQQPQHPYAEQRGQDEAESEFYAQNPNNAPYTSPFANPGPPSSFAASSTRYTPGVPLSPITERSFSSLRDSPRTPGTPASGVSGMGAGGGYFAGVRIPGRQASGERAPSRQGSGERMPVRQGSNESGISLSRVVLENRDVELGARPPREQQHPLARARPPIQSGTVSG